MITVLTRVHKAVEVVGDSGVALEESQLFQSIVTGLVRKSELALSDSLQAALEHDRAHEPVTEHEVAAVVVIVDDRLIALV